MAATHLFKRIRTAGVAVVIAGSLWLLGRTPTVQNAISSVRARTSPSAPEAGVSILVANLAGDDDKLKHTRLLVERINQYTGFWARLAGRSVELSKIDSIEDTSNASVQVGQELLRRKHSDLLVTGRVIDKQLHLQFLGRGEVAVAGGTYRLADERGVPPEMFETLGNALSKMAERERGTARLKGSIAAYRAALQERGKARAPLEWAATQYNLGVALSKLGERTESKERLEEAIAAFREALTEYTRPVMPMKWAETQASLGDAFSSLGDLESGTAQLEEAVEAYRAALLEQTKTRAPTAWATDQNKLGNVLSNIGERESGTARLEEAVSAYNSALQEFTREREPLVWAATERNLGTALRTIGDRQSGTARLKEAVAAYRAALQEETRERAPLAWAATQNSLGHALTTLGQREPGTARLQEAADAYRAALSAYREVAAESTRARVPSDWTVAIERNLSTLDSLLVKRRR